MSRYSIVVFLLICSVFGLGSCDHNDNKFCHKYSADGSCESFEEDEDEPCWIKEGQEKATTKEPNNGKLYRLEPYEVGLLVC